MYATFCRLVMQGTDVYTCNNWAGLDRHGILFQGISKGILGHGIATQSRSLCYSDILTSPLWQCRITLLLLRLRFAHCRICQHAKHSSKLSFSFPLKGNRKITQGIILSIV